MMKHGVRSSRGGVNRATQPTNSAANAAIQLLNLSSAFRSTAERPLGAADRSASAMFQLGTDQLAATDRHARRCLDADLYAIAAQADDGNTDLAVDDDFLSDFPRQDQHTLFSFAILSRPIRAG
jgi:hypothetical protein